MRQALRWSAALSLALAAACGGGQAGHEESGAGRAALDRDLTLQTGAPAVVEVASPVELGRAEPPRDPTPGRRSTPRPAPAPAAQPPAPEAAPTPEPVAVAVPVAVAALETPAPAQPAPLAGDRELAPGETVTVIPASTSGTGGDIGLPAEPGRGIFKGGAGNCPHPPRGIGGGRPIPVGVLRLPLSR